MSFKLTIIGSGSALPTMGRAVTAQYINFNERHILVDCGEGTQIQLRKFKVKIQRLQFILISHLHGDHYLGLMGLLSSLSLLGRTQKMTVFGPPELDELLQFHFKVAGVKLKYELDVVHLKTSEKEVIFEDNLIKIAAFKVKHRIDCWGFRFDEKIKELNVNPAKINEHQLTLEEILTVKKGEDVVREAEYLRNADLILPPQPLASYAYSSDTRYFSKMAKYVKGVRILYHEATFTEKHKERAEKTMHSTAKEAATVAKDAGVEQLLLGHFSARFRNTTEVCKEAHETFENTICVEDGDTFIL
ncbi:MAG: ribonuclease Z [Crocinitomicaceae bacterium]